MHTFASYIQNIFGMANRFNSIFLKKWAGRYCSTDKRPRKPLSQIVAKNKEAILKCVPY